MESSYLYLSNLSQEVYNIQEFQASAVRQFESDLSALKQQQLKNSVSSSAEEVEMEFQSIITACENLYNSGIKMQASISNLEQELWSYKSQHSFTRPQLVSQLSGQFSQRPILNIEHYLSVIDQLVLEVKKSLQYYRKHSHVKTQDDLKISLLEAERGLDSISLCIKRLESLKESFKELQFSYLILSMFLDESEQPDFDSYISVILNLVSGFGYMWNYYLLGLTAKDYMLELKMPESWSGILVASTPTCALIFCVIMSFWTNVSFRKPFLFTTFAITLGNIVYAAAYEMSSPFLLFLGRFCIGVGGSRVVNRRYTAETVSVKLRTNYSAYFVFAGSFGMALGPFIGAGLTNVNFKFLGLTVNSLTAPAYVSVIFWIVYTIITLIYFKEPKYRLSDYKLRADNVVSVTAPSDDGKSCYGAMLCFWTIFWPKFVQEAFITAAPMIAPMMFGWTSADVGQYLCIVSFIVLPVHFLIAMTSAYVKDRIYVLIGQIMTLIGAFLLISWSNIGEYEYIIGSLILFFATNMSDGVSVSLLSKKLPNKYAIGFWNTGFIATIGGNSGRLFGNIAVSMAGSDGKDHIENGVNVPSTIISLVTTVLVIVSWYKLDYRLIQAKK